MRGNKSPLFDLLLFLFSIFNDFNIINEPNFSVYSIINGFL